MNSPVRATADIKTDAAEAAPLKLSHTEATLAEMRREVVVLERRPTEPAPLDIAVARMRALAGQITDARREQRQLAVRDHHAHGAAADTEMEIVPVSRAAIAGLRAFRAVASDEDIRPALPPAQRVLAEPPLPAVATETSDPAISGPLPSAEDNSSTAGEQPPVPLRLADTSLGRFASAPQPTDIDFEANPTDSQLPALTHPAAGNDLPAPLPPGDAPSADLIPTDLRLVDLIRRQQTLLDQLNSYPSAPPPAADASFEPPLPAAPSVVDQLAPKPAHVAPETEPYDSPDDTIDDTAADSAPPPLPATFSTRLEVQADDPDTQLPERSPMIIERARAERSGRRGAGDAYTPPSPIPAFAAGITIALAIAGTLFYLL